jgi:hypothetical protein
VQRIKHVAAGFWPAFNHHNEFLFEFERGLEARSYVLNLEERLKRHKDLFWATGPEAAFTR